MSIELRKVKVNDKQRKIITGVVALAVIICVVMLFNNDKAIARAKEAEEEKKQEDEEKKEAQEKKVEESMETYTSAADGVTYELLQYKQGYRIFENKEELGYVYKRGNAPFFKPKSRAPSMPITHPVDKSFYTEMLSRLY